MASDRTVKPDKVKERTLDAGGPPQPPPGVPEEDPWDPYAAPAPVQSADGKAAESMPPRAAKLPSQNGTAMRTVFAYLLDEDDGPPPSGPPRKKKR